MCNLLQGEIVSWSETEKRLIGSKKQMLKCMYPGHRLITVAQNLGNRVKHSKKFEKSITCVYFNDNSCSFSYHRETLFLCILLKKGKVYNYTVVY